MNINNTVMMAVGLIVAVLLVSGLMVPVIGSLDSGTGGEQTFTNTGDFYYDQFVSGEVHTLTTEMSQDESTLTVLMDGEVITTWSRGFEPQMLPLWIEIGDDGIVEGMGMLHYQYNWNNQWWDDLLKNSEVYSMYLEDGQWATKSSISLIGIGSTLTFSDSGIVGGGRYPKNFTDDCMNVRYVSNEGDYVLSDKPHILSDTTYFTVGDYSYKNANDEYGYIRFMGYGDMNAVTLGCVQFDWWVADGVNGEEDWYGPVGFEYGSFIINGLEAFEISPIQTSSVSGGTQLDGFSVNTTWNVDYIEDSPTFTTKTDFNKFIVPVTITGSGSGNSGVPDTLMSLISVIPLITVVGIIIGAIGYLRFKE